MNSLAWFPGSEEAAKEVLYKPENAKLWEPGRECNWVSPNWPLSLRMSRRLIILFNSHLYIPLVRLLCRWLCTHRNDNPKCPAIFHLAPLINSNAPRDGSFFLLALASTANNSMLGPVWKGLLPIVRRHGVNWGDELGGSCRECRNGEDVDYLASTIGQFEHMSESPKGIPLVLSNVSSFVIDAQFWWVSISRSLGNHSGSSPHGLSSMCDCHNLIAVLFCTRPAEVSPSESEEFFELALWSFSDHSRSQSRV